MMLVIPLLKKNDLLWTDGNYYPIRVYLLKLANFDWLRIDTEKHRIKYVSMGSLMEERLDLYNTQHNTNIKPKDFIFEFTDNTLILKEITGLNSKEELVLFKLTVF